MFRNLSLWRAGRFGSAALTILALSGCVGSDNKLEIPPGVDTGPHIACQTVECECRASEGGLFGSTKKADIVWRENGEAACPEGFALKRIRRDFLGRER